MVSLGWVGMRWVGVGPVDECECAWERARASARAHPSPTSSPPSPPLPASLHSCGLAGRIQVCTHPDHACCSHPQCANIPAAAAVNATNTTMGNLTAPAYNATNTTVGNLTVSGANITSNETANTTTIGVRCAYVPAG